MPPSKRPKLRTRYSIGEWYGAGFEILTPNERFHRAQVEIEMDALTGTRCPFQKNVNCNKKGGVCSLRLYQQASDGLVSGTGPLVTTCPLRFLEDDAIFHWVGETILQTAQPIVLSEVGFLDRLNPNTPDETDEEDSRDYIGRIDNVVVHPSRNPIDWCALELQAVYFSGKAMKQEFTMLGEKENEALPFPAAHRRPDWRSSGPKRLLPQLQTKVPTIRTWGKKMAVVVDEAFFASLVGLEREKHLSNAEIAWFVVGYDPVPSRVLKNSFSRKKPCKFPKKIEGRFSKTCLFHQPARGWKLSRRDVVFTKLDSSVKALTGGVPLSRERFEDQLRLKLGTLHPDHPLGLKPG